MTKWKIFLAIVCSFVAGALILLAVLVYVPRTTKLDYEMSGFIISPDGEVLEEFTFTMYGKEYDFIIDRPGGGVGFTGDQEQVRRDAFVLRFDWGDASFASKCMYGHMVDAFRLTDTRMFTTLNYYDPTENDSHFESGLLDLEDETLCMYADYLADKAFIVGLTDPEVDPHAVIEAYLKHHKIPSELSPSENNGTAISWDMNGTFVRSHGSTDSVNFTVTGFIHDRQEGIDTLDITIAFPDNFRYLFNTPNPSFVSVNQKNNDLPHLIICPTYVYDKQTNSAVWTYFALDMEKQCIAVLFENMPHPLVASADTSADYRQLLDHFADFMESYTFED